MKKVIEHIEQLYLKDPIVFQWINMKNRGQITEEDALISLINALISNKNIAIKALEKRKKRPAGTVVSIVK